tara:strand:+ start:808 stop:1245 length:438 start_codon:yes stop_codon:yes gene_type:complete
MNVSIKELQENIKTLVETEMAQIQSVELILPENINVDNSIGYPKLVIFWDSSNTATFNENGNTIPLTFVFCDVAGSLNDEDRISFEIQSDCFQYASKLMDLLQREHYFNGELSESVTPFHAKYNDRLAGVSLTPSFIIAKPDFNV